MLGDAIGLPDSELVFVGTLPARVLGSGCARASSSVLYSRFGETLDKRRSVKETCMQARCHVPLRQHFSNGECRSEDTEDCWYDKRNEVQGWSAPSLTSIADVSSL